MSEFRGYRLGDVVAVLARIAGDDFDDWSWVRNTQCKYVSIAIDTRDGGYCTIKDRDGNSITLADLEHQYLPAVSP